MAFRFPSFSIIDWMSPTSTVKLLLFGYISLFSCITFIDWLSPSSAVKLSLIWDIFQFSCKTFYWLDICPISAVKLSLIGYLSQISCKTFIDWLSPSSAVKFSFIECLPVQLWNFFPFHFGIAVLPTLPHYCVPRVTACIHRICVFLGLTEDVWIRMYCMLSLPLLSALRW